MYILLKNIMALIMAISMFFPFFHKNTTPEPEIPDVENGIEYEELGYPLASAYEASIRANIPWDMVVWDGKLYVGGGDYDTNAGPVPVMCYDSDLKMWNNTGTVPDEQVNRFCVIGGKLIIMGTDPIESWELGNYYVLESDSWHTVRTIPYGVHNFDMVSYKNKIFAGLGVEGGYYPLACSYDYGVTFSQVTMCKDGRPIDTYGKNYVRVYDLAEFNDGLYAFFSCSEGEDKAVELYRYDDEEGIFEFECDLSDKLERKKISYDLLRSKFEHNGKLYFTTGVLYSTEDMQSFNKIDLPEDIVCDLYEDNGKIYALCGSVEGDSEYKISVWQLADGEFVEKFNFLYDVPPMSFACSGDVFYISMGNYAVTNAKNGLVVSVVVE